MAGISFRISTGIGKLIARNRKIIEDLAPALLAAEAANMKIIKEKAIKLSTNRAYSVKQGKKSRNYPYSISNPSPPIPDYMVNIQSGDFVKGWRTKTIPSRGGIVSSIWNRMPYSRFFDGSDTAKMIGRPILQKVFEQSRSVRLNNLRYVKNKVMQDAINSAKSDIKELGP